MTLPIHFATLHGGPQPLSLLDRQFAALGNLTTIPCAYSSPDGNVITLTPYPDTPALHRYTDLAPQFIFIAGTTNTGPMTINVMGAQAHPHGLDEMNLGSQPPGAGWPPPPPPVPLGARPAFMAGGTMPMQAGDVVANVIYTATFAQALNSGNGGFAVAPYGSSFGVAWPIWEPWTPSVTSSGGPYGAVTAVGQYVQMGHVVFFWVNINVSNKGGGSGTLLFTSPPPAPTPAPAFGIGRQGQAPSTVGFVEAGNPMGYANMDTTDPIPGGGGTIIASGWYQVG